MKCSTTGCENEAVVQWQKRLAGDHLSSYLTSLHEQLVAQAEEQRLGIRVQIASLQVDPPPALSAADTQAFQSRVAQQIEDLQQQHDAIPASFDLSHQEEDSTMSQFSCGEHRHDDEWCARVHKADCSGESDCGCS